MIPQLPHRHARDDPRERGTPPHWRVCNQFSRVAFCHVILASSRPGRPDASQWRPFTPSKHQSIRPNRPSAIQSVLFHCHCTRGSKRARRTWRRPEPQASASRDMEKTGAPATLRRIAPSMQPTHTGGPPSGQASGSCAVPCTATPQIGRQPADLTPWTPLQVGRRSTGWAGHDGCPADHDIVLDGSPKIRCPAPLGKGVSLKQLHPRLVSGEHAHGTCTRHTQLKPEHMCTDALDQTSIPVV
jgi:hypothetical protein